MKVTKHDGSQHHLFGIQPAIPMELTIAGIREGRDELLERAPEVIRGQGGRGYAFTAEPAPESTLS